MGHVTARPVEKTQSRTNGTSSRRATNVRYIVPNMLTLLALCCGISAIRLAFEGAFELAALLILLAAILDACDGRVARLLDGTSRFGEQLDSLADLVNFGVAPALLIYLWSLAPLGVVGWVAALVFALCQALRLARFNASIDELDKPLWATQYFAGIPAPAAAFLALGPFYLSHFIALNDATTAPYVLAYIGLISYAMISRLPTFSGKLIGRRLSRAMLLPPLIAALILPAIMAFYPWHVLTGLCLAYILSLPLSAWRYRAARLRKS